MSDAKVCSDGFVDGLKGAGYALGGLFGLNNFISDPASKDSVTELQNQIKDTYDQMHQKIQDLKDKSTERNICIAEAHLQAYQKNEEIVTEMLDEKIQTAFVLIYGLIFCVLIMYIYLLVRT